MLMHLFVAGLGTETNTFTPIPTALNDFAVVGAIADVSTVFFGSTIALWAELAAARGWRTSFGGHAFAQPSGITTRAAYETLRDTLLTRLEAALPVDVVLLCLHGAMVADGYADCEGDLVRRVRALVGPAVIGVELDLHCDIVPQMVEDADLIVTFKEYPHIDVDDRARELFTLAAAAAEGRITPTMARYDCRMIGFYRTTQEPMRSFVDWMSALEGAGGVLSVSLAHGFPYADVPTTGSYALAVTDGDAELAARTAAAIGQRLYDLRHDLIKVLPSFPEALDAALALRGAGPVVLADTADNTGGGAPGDSTFALRELLARGVANVGLALIYDPGAVRIAMAAGVGARLPLRLGGKLGPTSGDPLDLTVTVRGAITGMLQHWPQREGAIAIPCGDCVWLECAGVDIIVGSVRSQVFGSDLFSNFGIDPTTKRLLVVKSSQHFHAAYGPIAAAVLYAGSPGALAGDLTTLPFTQIDRGKYPFADVD
jgi:microcystin degradation protein MlrC